MKYKKTIGVMAVCCVFGTAGYQCSGIYSVRSKSSPNFKQLNLFLEKQLKCSVINKIKKHLKEINIF